MTSTNVLYRDFIFIFILYRTVEALLFKKSPSFLWSNSLSIIKLEFYIIRLVTVICFILSINFTFHHKLPISSNYSWFHELHIFRECMI